MATYLRTRTEPLSVPGRISNHAQRACRRRSLPPVAAAAGRGGGARTAGAMHVHAAHAALAPGLRRVLAPGANGHAEAAAAIAQARPLLMKAAGGPVAATIGTHDPVAAVEDA